MQAVDSYVGLKIRRLQFMAVVMIVVIHSTFLSTNVIVRLLTQWAVPFFLCVSGCMFSVSIERNSAVEIVRKKFLTLVVPYIFWVTLGWITLGSGDVWHAYGITTAMPTGLGVFWFVRQLVVSMAVLLALEELVKLIGCRTWHRLISVGVYCVLFLAVSRIEWIVAMPASPFWFVLGYVLAPVLLANRMRDKHKLSWFLAIILFVVAIVVRCCWSQVGGEGEILIRNGCNLLMMTSLWFFYDGACVGRVEGLAEGRYSWRNGMLSCTFGIYCVHMFVLSILSFMPALPRFISGLFVSLLLVLGLCRYFPAFGLWALGGRLGISRRCVR